MAEQRRVPDEQDRLFALLFDLGKNLVGIALRLQGPGGPRLPDAEGPCGGLGSLPRPRVRGRQDEADARRDGGNPPAGRLRLLTTPRGQAPVPVPSASPPVLGRAP